MEINLIKLVKLLHIELKIMKNYYKSRRYTFRSIPKKPLWNKYLKLSKIVVILTSFVNLTKKKTLKSKTVVCRNNESMSNKLNVLQCICMSLHLHREMLNYY